MSKIDVSAVRDVIREVATTIVLPRFRHLKAGEVDFKIGDDPVTIADKEAESALSTRLMALLPGSKVLGEEAFFANPGLLSLFSGDDPVWIIDPIDGTRNFVGGKPIFAIIVSLTERNQTVAGWIYDPLSGECLIAEKGAGAYHKNRKISVLPSDFLDKMRGCSMDLEAALARVRRRGSEGALSGPTLDTPLLSMAHEYARLAIGAPAMSARGAQWHFHATLGFCTPWDNAAGILIHAEAGGYGAHWNGDPYTPSAYGRGVLLAPDQPSWHALRNWAALITDLPEE
jgi:fructose-1,6-bisphosphatase/inositol monophosphatase family enzyme